MNLVSGLMLLQPSYWCGTKQDLSRNRGSSSVAMDTVDPINSGKFESEPQNLQAGIQIRGLTKKFKGRGNSKEKVCYIQSLSPLVSFKWLMVSDLSYLGQILYLIVKCVSTDVGWPMDDAMDLHCRWL